MLDPNSAKEYALTKNPRLRNDHTHKTASPPANLPHHTLLRHNATTPIRPRINQNIIDLFETMPQIQRRPHRRGLKIDTRAGTIRPGNTVAEEQRPQTKPLMGRRYGET